MKFEEQPQSQPPSVEKTAETGKAVGVQKEAQPLSAGEIKVNEYVSRIQGGESKDSIFQGLPESFRSRIEDKLAQSTEEDEKGIPPQYRGLNSEILDEIWTIPEYVDREKTKELKDKKAKAVAALRERELSETVKKERQAADEQKIAELRQQLGIEKPLESPAATAKAETSHPSAETGSLSIEERKKLSGWNAGYELAKIAKQQGLDLSTLSREEYVDYAIQNFLAIDDSQLRMPPWQRMCESAQEIVATNKEKRALISKEADAAFSKFCFEIQKKAGEDDRSIQDGIRIRQGTKDSNSWLFFKVNNGTAEGSKETFKSYVSVKDLNKLTPERFTSLMAALRDAGYNGDIKIFQDMAMQGVNLNDQIVMHGASENDAKLALSVAEKFFGDDLDQKSVGKDEVVDGKNHSYSEILAKKIKDAINPPKKP
ncbi:MAG: hypothetical protein BWX94_01569 [Tenericutes bacterium ADurb.Bin140]|nr:MAG: hypothetical protein BWX94_01569 [Tenericutes bacterium ADurb.Bin140]